MNWTSASAIRTRTSISWLLVAAFRSWKRIKRQNVMNLNLCISIIQLLECAIPPLCTPSGLLLLLLYRHNHLQGMIIHPIKLCWESNFAARLFSHFWDSYYAAPQYPSNSHLQPHSMVWSLYPSNSHRRQWLAVRTRSNNYKIIGLLTGAYIGRIFRKHYYGNCLHHHHH